MGSAQRRARRKLHYGITANVLTLLLHPALIVFFEANCPTCQLAIPYLNKLARQVRVVGISQDDEAATNEFVQRWETAFPVQLDPHLALSRAFDLAFVPSLFLIAPEALPWRGHPTQRKQRMISMRSDHKPRQVVVNTRDAD